MPTAIAGYLVKLGASKLVAAIASVVINIGITAGANVLLTQIFGRGGARPSDGQQNVSEAVGSRFRDYGIVESGGQRTFLESANGTLGIVITLATGQQSAILQHKINGRPVTVVGGTVTEASYHGAIHIYTRDGAEDQTAIGELTAKFPQWTSDHRQLGCPHVAIVCDPVKQQHFAEVFTGQMPIYTQARKGVSLYDPRKDSTAVIGWDESGGELMGDGAHRLDDPATWEWSDNGPLVIADYFAHRDGYGAGYEAVNWTNIAREADFADATLEAASGETIRRWRIWARYALASTERRQVLKDMLKAVDGFTWQDAEGLFNLMVGRFEEPDVILTDDHILSLSVTLGPQAQQRVNAIKALYTEAAMGYREQESATVFDPELPNDPNTDPQALEAFYAPHHNQAVRVGKLALLRLGDRWHLTGLVNVFGLNLLGQRFCRVRSAAADIDACFAISRLKLNLRDITVQVQLDEVRPADWDLAPEDEGNAGAVPDASAPPPPLPAPTGLALSAVQVALGEVNGVTIGATWDDPGRADLTWEAMHRPSAGGTWVPMAVDNDARTARSGPVDSGVEQEVSVWAVTLTGRRSADPATATITPTADAVTLGPPTDLSAVGGVAAADVAFRLPTGATLSYARLYRTASASFTSPTQVGGDIVGGLGEVIEINVTGLSAGTVYFWARAFDGAGNPSALAGGVAAPIS